MKLIKVNDGREFTRSRWIKIQQNYNPTKKNKLWDFVTDDSGYHPYQEKINSDNGLFLDYFRHKGNNYALEQFIRIGSMVCPGEPPYYEDHEGKHLLCAVDFYGDMYHPCYIELDNCGEQVRVYEEVNI